MDGKVRKTKECEVDNCYNIPEHINGSKWAKKCIFHKEKGKEND
jgi:hypothetical protein